MNFHETLRVPEYRCRFCGWNYHQQRAPKTCECLQNQRGSMANEDYQALVENGYRVNWSYHIVKESYGFAHMHFECRVSHFLRSPSPKDVGGVYEKVPIDQNGKPLEYCKKPLERMMRRAKTFFIDGDN